jgi:catechol 2,3-dioxygenase-like lactoylglutathione lyase family enzyme
MITSIQTITIPVADQERALGFYRDTLGFEVRQDNAFGDSRWLTVAPVGGQTEMVLHIPFPGTEPGGSRGVVLTTDDADAVATSLRSAGIAVDGPEQVGWGIQATFSDPDGYGFVLMQQPAAAK